MATEFRNEETGFFIISDAIYEMEPALTPYAITIYFYLRKLGNKEGQAFPSYKSIMDRCAIRSRATVKKAMDELVGRGLLHVENRIKEGKKELTSNLYTAFVKPSPNAGYIKLLQKKKDEGSSLDELEVVHDVNYPSSRRELELYPLNQTQFNQRGGEAPPAEKKSVGVPSENAQPTPTQNQDLKALPKEQALSTEGGTPQVLTYGEFKTVELKAEERAQLDKLYGEDVVTDYIARIDEHQASIGKRYKGQYATIAKWINQDIRKQLLKAQADQPKPNKFVNFDQRKNDYEKYERLEREYRLQKLAAME